MEIFYVRIDKIFYMSAIPVFTLRLWFRVVSHGFLKSKIIIFIVNSSQVVLNNLLFSEFLRIARHYMRQGVFLKEHRVHPFAKLVINVYFW